MPSEAPLLEVTVISGKDLAPKDDNGFSDPYCVLRLSSGTGAKRTYPIKKTLNPTWNQTFELGALLPTSTLKLTCWDHDTFSSDDFMGQIVLDIGNRLLSDDKGWLNEWFQLMERGRNEGITGSLHLKFTIKKAEAKSGKTGGLLGAGGLLALVPDIPKGLPSLGGSSSTGSKSGKAKESAVSDTKIFGTELSVVMKRQAARGIQEPVPVFYKKLIAYLRTVAPQEEGIFRIGGTHSKIIDLMDAVNAGEEVDYNTIDVNDASGLLKRYLRDLPTPLLTFELFDKLVVKGPMPNADDYLDLLKSCISGLPPVNLAMLEMLVELMQLITANSDKNKMSTQNLVICIGPNLLRDETDSIMLNMEYLGKVQSIITFLVQQHSYIFKFKSAENPRSRLSKADRVESTRQVEGGRLFMTYDTNGDGNMDREEFAVFYREALMDISATDADVDSALRVLDSDGNNLISFQEFTEWWCRMHSRCDRALGRLGEAAAAPGAGPTRSGGGQAPKLPPANGGQTLLSPRQNGGQPRLSPRRGGPQRGRGAPARGRGVPRGGRGAPRGGRGAPRGQRGAPRGQRGVPRGQRGAPRGARGVPRGRGARGAPRGRGFHGPPTDPAPARPQQ